MEILEKGRKGAGDLVEPVRGYPMAVMGTSPANYHYPKGSEHTIRSDSFIRWGTSMSAISDAHKGIYTQLDCSHSIFCAPN